MALTKERKEEIVKKYARTEGDTGSCEVQIALLTESIKNERTSAHTSLSSLTGSDLKSFALLILSKSGVAISDT